MRLGTNITLLPLWPIRLLAEEVAVLDILSNGRFTLGLGLGYVQHEFAAFGVDRKERKKRMEAGISYVRTAFRGEPVADGYEGASLPVTPHPVQGERLTRRIQTSVARSARWRRLLRVSPAGIG